MKRSFLVMVALVMLVTAGATQPALLGTPAFADKNQDQGRNDTSAHGFVL